MENKIETQVNTSVETKVETAQVAAAIKAVPAKLPTKMPVTAEELEHQLSVKMSFEEHIDKKQGEDKYHVVITGTAGCIIEICRKYKFREVDKAVPDFMAQGHKMSDKKFKELLEIKTARVRAHISGNFHTGIGWHKYQGGQVFLYGDAADKSGKLVSDYRGQLPLEKRGTSSDYIEGIKKWVVPNTKLLLVYLAGASGILNQQLHLTDSNIMINICGESGSGKTTAENVALSVWGNPMELATSFNSTINRTEQVMAQRIIMPVLVDDILAGKVYSTERTQQKHICEQIFRYSTGKLKGRLNENEDRYYGAAIASSETSLFQKMAGSEADGQFYRMIELHVKKGDLTKDAAHARQLDKLVQRNHGWAAFELGKFMVEQDYVGERLNDLYYGEREDLSEDSRLGQHQRAANRLAIITTTAKLMNECFKLGIDMEALKEALIEAVQEAFSISDMKAKAYKDLQKLVLNNKELFAANRETYDLKKHIGVYQRNVYGNYELIVETDRMAPLLKNVPLHQILDGAGNKKVKQSPDKEILNILKNWRERGWVNNCGSTQRLYRKLKMGGAKEVLVYTVKLESSETEVTSQPGGDGNGEN